LRGPVCEGLGAEQDGLVEFDALRPVTREPVHLRESEGGFGPARVEARGGGEGALGAVEVPLHGEGGPLLKLARVVGFDGGHGGRGGAAPQRFGRRLGVAGVCWREQRNEGGRQKHVFERTAHGATLLCDERDGDFAYL